MKNLFKKTRTHILLVAKLLAMFLLPLCILCNSCKKKPADPIIEVDTSKQPVATKRGDPIGTPITKTVGPEGGVIIADGDSLKIVIPAGALDVPTNFSIQKVTKTLGKAGLGLSYRLLPEDIAFKKDIEINYSYDERVKTLTSQSLLALAYQDRNGFWHRTRNTVVDSANRVLKVATRHFSDWTSHSRLIIESKGKSRLMAGETTELKATAQFFSDDVNDLLAPEVELKASDILQWKVVSGLGEIADQGVSAKFTAPATIAEPSVSKIMVQCKVENTSITEYAFVDLELVPEQYLVYYVEGKRAFTKTLSASVGFGNNISIAATNPGGFNIVLDGVEKGNYNFGPPGVPGSARMTIAGGIVLGTFRSSGYCAGTYHIMSGSVKIASVTGYVSGDFSGTLFLSLGYGCDPADQITVKGSFRYKLP